MGIAARLRFAIRRRDALPFEAVRVFDGAGDGAARLIVERYGSAWYARGAPDMAATLPAIRAAIPADAPLFWRFGHEQIGGPRDDDGRREVDELGMRFRVVLDGRRNVGLFLDGRSARAWVRAHSVGRRVLNLFAFTCGFGVAAAAGGARSTVNVDSSRSALDWGRDHYALNDLGFDSRTFWRSDAVSALRHLARRDARFDAVVLDPPPVPARSRNGRRVDVAHHLGGLMARAWARLDDGGWLMVLVATDRVDLDAAITVAALPPPSWIGRSGPDFTPAPDRAGLRVLVFYASSGPR